MTKPQKTTATKRPRQLRTKKKRRAASLFHMQTCPMCGGYASSLHILNCNIDRGITPLSGRKS